MGYYIISIHVSSIANEQVDADDDPYKGRNAQVNATLEHKVVVARHFLHLHDNQRQEYARYDSIN